MGARLDSNYGPQDDSYTHLTLPTNSPVYNLGGGDCSVNIDSDKVYM